ncbi:glycosyltransferase family 2 protein [Brachybacterium sp. J153]|uniref:glycosyltransferase family 2 protein n=1 Tax=Brachybacterium sp. J153 TaxID=3116488 RepID=UPI002E781D82|nr:glycosyltransferase family A protein [Brachybacterium sp. J153]MEE1617838.1 glycosyltransferase family A protein [Brachybacterium sp. J153]
MTKTPASSSPLISVVIATRNRAAMLRDSLHSVLCQTYSNLEVIVVDDGSEDETRSVVEELGDARLVYVHQEHSGISAARNRGTERAQGEWLAVHDDDDIMLPTRLADQLDHVDESVDFVYGAFLNFDDETGELQLHHGRNYGYGPALMSGFAPGHSTWLVRTSVMRAFPYDEGIESAVDNNLVFRMLRSGVRFRHSGVICLLRRVHSGRITNTGGAGQKYVAGLNLQFIGRGVAPHDHQRLTKAARRDWGPVDKDRWQTRYLPFLPDHLVARSGYLTSRTAVESGDTDPSTPSSPVFHLDVVDVAGMTWWDFIAACAHATDLGSVVARPKESAEIEALLVDVEVTAELDRPDVPQEALAMLLDLTGADESAAYFAIAAQPAPRWTAEQQALTTARCSVSEKGEETMLGIVPLRSWSAARSLREAAFRDADSFRVFSHKPAAAIIAELDTPS